MIRLINHLQRSIYINFALPFIVLMVMFLCTSGNLNAAKWTIMVYLAADNDLEPFGISDMNEMETVGSTNDVNILVQIDRAVGYDKSNGDWTDTRRYRVLKDNDQNTITSPVIANLGELNMGDPKTLTDFIKWGATNYPADNYFLVLWNHGGGWKNIRKNISNYLISPVGNAPNVSTLGGIIKSTNKGSNKKVKEFLNPFHRITWTYKDVCYDDADQDHLSNKEVASGIQASGVKLSIVGFDACLMAMVENAYPLRNLTSYMIASEELEPGDGYPYNLTLSEVVGNPNISPSDLCKRAIVRWAQFYEGSANDKDKTTQSAIDMSKIGNLTTAIDNFVNAAKTDNNSWTGIMKAREESHSFNKGQYRDLWHFCDLVTKYVASDPVKNAANSLKTAVTDAVIANYVGDKFKNAKGISIYFPSSGDYESSYGTNAHNLEFISSSQWPSFLQAAYSAGPGNDNIFDPNDMNEPNNNWALASGPVENKTYQGIIRFNNDIDFFRFETGNASGLTVKLESPSNIDFDLIIGKIEADTITILSISATPANEDDIIVLNYPAGIYYAIVAPGEAPNFDNNPYKLTFSGITPFTERNYSRTLAYDFGGLDFIWQITSINPSEGAVSLYKLPKSPAKLKKIWYFVTSLQTIPGTGSFGSFYFYAFDYYGLLFDDGMGGFRIGTPPRTGWVYADFSNENIPLYGDFGVGMMFDGINSPGIGYDTLQSYGTNLILADPYGYGVDWYESPGIFFIRAEVSYFDLFTGIEETFFVSPFNVENYPNPFKEETKIRYSLEKEDFVNLSFYKLTGELLLTGVNEFKNAGSYEFNFSSFGLPSGTYFYTLKIGDKETTKKMIIMK